MTTTPVSPITPAQKRLAAHLVQGLSNSEIAAEEYLAPDTVSSHVRGIRQNLHCPPRSSRPVLAHALLLHGQVEAPPLPALRPAFEANEHERLLLRAIAEHSAPADIARAAKIAPRDLKSRTEELVRAAGASDSTHLVGLGHALGLLGPAGHDAASRPAAPEGVGL
ncbi:LuxR C-terminal-related transcriptional regulator [Streptomyces goshikiensis]|uniref:LuxR C-terminal-related transcriptional regulator n=1 Tax=Streptomyces goshikiensis TaxID=1942 RepID=UPI0036C69189